MSNPTTTTKRKKTDIRDATKENKLFHKNDD